MSKQVICIGAALVDELLHAADKILMKTTNSVVATRTAGGVGRNIAHQLALLDVPVQLISVFGKDADGRWLQDLCTSVGIRLDASITTTVTTGRYTGIINADGSLFTALLTYPSLHLLTPQYFEEHIELLNTAAYILIDTNLSVEAMAWLIGFTNKTGIPLIIEPASVEPARKLSLLNLQGVYMITPNEDELPVICSPNAATTAQQIEELLTKGVQNIWLHKGPEGSALYSQQRQLPLAAPEAEVVDCTGAGDGSAAAFIMAKFHGKDDYTALKTAHTLSAEILQVNGAIANHITQHQLVQLVSKYYP